MGELESAVLLSLDPAADKLLRERAFQYCQEIRQSPDGWAFVLQHLSISMRPQVTFWCLQVIHETLSNPERYPAAFSAEQACIVRQKILQFFSHIVYPESSRNTPSNQQAFPSFLLNKVAQVVVSLISAEYPHRWRAAFRETVLPLVSGTQTTHPSISMFFRLLRTLDDDVTSIRATQAGEAARQTSIRVKDAMRDDCVAEIITRCTEKLTSEIFVSQAFDVLARYVEWVDIGLIVQQQILSPMYSAITSKTWSNVRAAAAAALRAIILKRMDSDAKVGLLNALKIDSLLQSIPVNEIIAVDSENGDPGLNLQSGQVEVASLVNAIAIVALDILKDALKESKQEKKSPHISTDSARIARTAVPVVLRFLHENADEETSSQTLQCVTNYVNVFSRAAKSGVNSDSGNEIAAMAAILKVVEERSMFTREFDPRDDQLDENRDFLELRSILIKNVFTSVARAFPDLCLDFVNNLLSEASKSGNVQRTELGMSLLITLITACPDLPSIMQLRRDVIVNPPACMSFTSDLSNGSLDKVQLAQKHQLERISSTYYDLVARSYRMFLTRTDPTLLPTVLPVFFDGRGLGHASSEVVRSHAAYSLLKLVRPLRSVAANNHLDAILNAVQAKLLPLNPDVNSQGSKNQMMIFETVGYLLGTDHKKEKSLQYLTAILTRIIQGMQTTTGTDPVPYITAAGFLSKGFGGDSKPLLLLNDSRRDQSPDSIGRPSANGDNAGKEVKVQRLTPLSGDMQMTWISCLEAVLRVSAAALKGAEAASSQELRYKALFFLHRMVDTIGLPVLPYLEQILPDILASAAASPVEIRDILILVSQAVTKFGEASEQMAMSVYAPIVKHVHRHSYQLDPKTLMAVSEESREAVEMHRAYTYFLHAIVGSKLIRIVIHSNHAGLMQGVMTSLLSSALGEYLDIRVSSSVMKMCLHMLAQMTAQWASGNDASRGGPAGFREFALKEISRVSVLCGVRGTLFRFGDYSGGQAVALLTEVVLLQRTCATHLGMDFAEAVRSGEWGKLPKQTVETYLTALYTSSTTTATLVAALASLCRMVRNT
eukprot:GFKZ01014917.1.p1 GENE.GFKZ01014917.1~~GFKZ01014917.1.p1  ORF type:complete len:1057 (-),score=147.45 GFKZ01014917.1:3778-6948(-)